MKIIFLDIDGVLNSQRTCVANNGYPHDFLPSSMEMFDHVAIKLIRKACELSGASIVLSSTWRIMHTVHEVANGLDLPVFDKTTTKDGRRGKQIQEWIDKNPQVTNYAIIDDDSDMEPSQQNNFVHTDYLDGFVWRDFTRLCFLLDCEY